MSFPKYPKYTFSGVEELGDVPEHWSIKPLKHLAAVDSCGSYGVDGEVHLVDHTMPVATTAQIDADGRFSVADMPLRGFTTLECQRYGCRNGDVLVVKSSGSATNIISGKAGLVTKETPPFIFSNFLMRIRPRPELANARFIYALLRSQLTRQRVEQMCSTTTYPNLKVSEYTSAPMPIPPVDEQVVIADFLDRETSKIDSLVAEQRRLIELLKEKRQAVISHAVTKGLNPHAPMKPSGIEWLGDLPEHWGVIALKRVAVVRTGVAKGKDLGDLATVNVPYLRVANVQDGYLQLDEIATIDILPHELERYRLQSGDVLMNEGGDFDKLGRGYVWEGQIDPCITQNHVFAVRPMSVDSWWLNSITSSEYAQFYFMSQSKQSTNLASISSTNLMNLPVILPPPAEQQQILDFVHRSTAQFDSLITEAERAIELLQERRTALISAAVTGKIDVRKLVEAN